MSEHDSYSRYIDVFSTWRNFHTLMTNKKVVFRP